MTLDEIINRLQVLREDFGGDTKFCIETHRSPDGRVNVFDLATVDVYHVMESRCGDRPYFVCLMTVGTTTIVVDR